MNKEKYISELETDINTLLSEYKLNNYKNQAFAWKLNAEFNRTFNERYLWNRALFLSTNSCILIQNNGNKKTALKGLYESAEIFEYLSELPEINKIYDPEHLLILSSLCYDLSGYQANSYCVAERISTYEFITSETNIDLKADNIIINQIRLILLKKIPLAFYNLGQKSEYESDNIGLNLFQTALNGWYENILKLNDNNDLSDFDKAYEYFLYSGNTYLSHLIFLLKTRVFVFNERSIWNSIKKSINKDIRWKKYVKLLAYDYYSTNAINDVKDRKSIFEFWTSQLRAIEEGLLRLDENFVVQMPTSSGKTFIAELSILKYLLKYPKKKCIYIAPFRALTNEKEIELSKYFSKLGFSVSSLSGSYEIDKFQDVILSETDLLIATPEKIDLLLRLNPKIFNDISFIVIDEGHIIGDVSTRATLLEFLIIRLRIKIPEIKTLFISAVMPPHNADEYSLWLSGKKTNVLRSLKFPDSNFDEEWEPTRKLISHFDWMGNKGNITFENVITEDEETKIRQGATLYSFLVDKEFGNKYPHKKNKKETAAALAYKLSDEGNTLVFCAQVRWIKIVAESLLSLLNIIEDTPNRFKENKNKKSSYYANLWFGKDSFVTKSINQGIGIHYGDMPEQVRNAVEDDYRNGNLIVLLSTNTIGQGLNFPIKNLIFYSITIGFNEGPINIQHRDFWNIVGRAGRAGKETEGRIIYIINSKTDRRLYDSFINKKNIENADSLVFKVLDALSDNRINKDTFTNYLSILSESYLLDLLTEEVVGTEYEEIINNIINNSLFKIQSDKRELNLTPLIKGFKKIYKKFEDNSTPEQLNIYRTTGLSFKSNEIIDKFIEENIDDLQRIIKNDSYLKIVQMFLELLSSNVLSEFDDYKLDRLQIELSDSLNIIEVWINGMPVNDLISYWEKETGKDVLDFHIFISKGLYYLYPWGITSFLIILSYKLSIEFDDFPDNIKNLTSYMKYGLNNSTSCLARSIGVKNRQVSLFLYKQSKFSEGKRFIRWLSNLTNQEIDSFNISIFDKQNLENVSLKLTPNSYRTNIERFQFFIKGIYINSDWSEFSKKINIGDTLSFKREEHNEFDPYAILILKEEKTIGYVPREYSKLIASEIDIENTEYNIFVVDVSVNEKFNDIEIIIEKSG